MNADAAAVSVTIEVPARPAGPVGPLPRTGGDFGVLVAVGFTLILVGVLVLTLARARLEDFHA